MNNTPKNVLKCTLIPAVLCLASCGADSGSADTAAITANDEADSGLDALPQREPGVYTTVGQCRGSRSPNCLLTFALRQRKAAISPAAYRFCQTMRMVR